MGILCINCSHARSKLLRVALFSEPGLRPAGFSFSSILFRQLAFKANYPNNGAEDGTRTHDLLVTNELLYQLSHFGIP